MKQVKLTLPDGKEIQIESGSNLFEVAKKISPSLAKKVLVGIYNGEHIDLHTPILKDGSIKLIDSFDDEYAFRALNHTAAHVLSFAVKKLYPGIVIEYGPQTEEGFFHNYHETGNVKISSLDFPKIEKEMQRIIDGNAKIVRSEKSIAEALTFFKENKYKTYQIEKIKQAKGKTVSFYSIGEYDDLCSGPHTISLANIKAFKLLSISAAYHLGDAKNDSLTRIYGSAHFSKDSLTNYLNLVSERAERDHRKIGKELKIFMISDSIGKGLPVWLENGTKLKNAIRDLVKEKELKYGFRHVETPAIGSTYLFETSGHYPHYADTMFPIMDVDGEKFILRPMSCPFHIQIFEHEQRSYRDLPLRYAEEALLHRYEKSGALIGLERVRAMSLTDSHIFARPDQIEQEFEVCWNLIQEVLSEFSLKIDFVELALHDPNDKEKFFDDPKMWKESEAQLEKILIKNKIVYKKAIGEAAFYGPKVDLQFKTVLGHTITVSTIQLDFLQPKKFNITYIDNKGQKVSPIMVHRGLIGTYERFISVLLEQTKGVLPFRFAPEQVRIIPVSEVFGKYATSISEMLNTLGIRNSIDSREETLNLKIREAQVSKIPYQFILGEKEVSSKTISYRKYGSTDTVTIKASLDSIVKIKND